jgi:hypothetical protein
MKILEFRRFFSSARLPGNARENIYLHLKCRAWRMIRLSALTLFGAAITTQAAMATSVLVTPDVSVQPVIAAPNVARVITLRPLWFQNCPLPTVSIDPTLLERSNILVIRARRSIVIPPNCTSDVLLPIQLEIPYTPTKAGALRIVMQSDIPSLRLEGNLITSESATVRSLRDISGLWFDPTKSGSGLFFQHGFNNSDTVFGSLYLYDQQGVTRWYSIQNGRWLPSGDLEATLFETRSPNGCTTAPPNCPAPAIISRTVGMVTISVSDANTLTKQPIQMLLGARTSDNQVIFESLQLNRLEF